LIEFESFCYLQNHKTGCTYVETFIRKFCTEGIYFYKKHAIPNKIKNKFYFINTRDPLDTYLSLFNYGLDSKGEVYERLVKYGHANLYKAGIGGFEDWLSFILDPMSARYLFDSKSQNISHQIGLLSYRFLGLSCEGFRTNMESLLDQSLIEAYYKNHSIVNLVIKNESMKGQLIDLITGPLKHAFLNTDKALAWLNEDQRINASSRRDKSSASHPISEKLLNELKSREWFIYKYFYG